VKVELKNSSFKSKGLGIEQDFSAMIDYSSCILHVSSKHYL